MDLHGNHYIGGRKLLTTQTASSDATLDFTEKITTDFRLYLFELVNVVPATDGVGMLLRMSTDGGATFKDGSTDYRYQTDASESVGGGVNNKNDLTAGEIWLVTGNASYDLGNAVKGGICGNILIHDPMSTATQTMVSYNTEPTNDTKAILSYGAGSYNTTGATNGFQFLMESGNIAEGIINFYGIVK